MLIILGGFIRIPLAVPVTLQASAVLLCGVTFGKKCALWGTLLYISLGLLGLPVFAQGGGLWYFAVPTFGYLLGFAPAAYLAGTLTQRLEEKGRLNFARLFAALMLPLGVIYLVGVPYLIICTRITAPQSGDIAQLLGGGLLVCAPIDAVLCLPIAAAGLRIRRAVD